jgi:thioredoxin 1
MIGVVVLSGAVVLVPLALKRRSGGDAASGAPTARAETPAGVASARKLPKLVDLGTTSCAPCKAMLTVMDELERSYADQLAVEFINIQQHEEAVETYRVQVIPTQVFLGPDGKELFRHTGFYSTEAILGKWHELGYPLTRGPLGG